MALNPIAAVVILAASMLAVTALAGCRRKHYEVVAGGAVTLQLTSASFHDGRIPAVYTCDGADTSPQLAWTAPPSATKSFALLMADPDAPGNEFVHWVLYNLPANTRALPEGLPKLAQLSDGSLQGMNDFPKIGYGGPCPPHGTHHYVFVVYAVDTRLNLPAETTKSRVEEALKGHVLDHGELIGRYGR